MKEKKVFYLYKIGFVDVILEFIDNDVIIIILTELFNYNKR